MRQIKIFGLLLLLIVAALGAAAAAEPPPLLNYQGVLRDAGGSPADGDFDMVFRFFDAATLGNEILIDSHLASSGGAVAVSGGLFNAQLGSGGIADGSAVLPNDPYTSLAHVFRDFASVYMEIQIGAETLSPRIRVVGAPYALNADHLDGKNSSQYLDTSATAQTKTGSLAVGGLSVNGLVTIAGGSPAAGRVLTSDAVGRASWQDAPGVQAIQLQDLADRLGTEDPSTLPFAALGSFDCTGGNTATLSFSIDGALLGEVVGFVGVDRLSAPFEYRVAIQTSGAALDLNAQIGRAGRISLQRAGRLTTFSGRITEFGLAAQSGTLRTYVSRLEPALSRLGRSTGYSIHQNRNAPDILSSILLDAGLSNFETNLGGTYLVRDMVIQYDEPLLSFFNRLAEDAGIHYHFREGAAAETLILGDSNSAMTAIPGSLTYHDDMRDPDAGEEFVSTFHAPRREFTGSATARAYDFTAAATRAGSAVIAGGIGEFYEFIMLQGLSVPEEVSARAGRSLEREQVRRLEHTGSSNAADLKAGHLFTLSDKTTAGFGGSYVVTGITHFALSGAAPSCISYGNVFSALPSATPYRPERATPTPKIPGPLTAVVTGPAGTETFVDEAGMGFNRVKVQFHWDRTGTFDENSSAWVRVATPSGKTQRDLFIPRVGTEVLVDFVQGDLAQPVVIGSLYNGAHVPLLQDQVRTSKLIVGDGCLSSLGFVPREQNIFFCDQNQLERQFLRWNHIRELFELSGDLVLPSRLILGPPDGASFLRWDDVVGSPEFTERLGVVGELRSGSLVTNTLDITGDMQATGNLVVGGDMAGSGKFDLLGNLKVGGTMAGASTLNLPGPILLGSATISASGSQVQMPGNVLVGDLQVSGGDITGSLLNISSTTLDLLSSATRVRSNGDAVTVIDNDNNSALSVASWFRDGSFANTSKLAELQESGNLRIRGALSQFVSFDLAESFRANEPVEAGDLVRLDPRSAGAVRLTEGAADALVIGVVSGQPGILLGGAPFDAGTLKSTWGDDVAALYERDRGRLRERVLADHGEVRRALAEAEALETEPAPGADVEDPDTVVDTADASADGGFSSASQPDGSAGEITGSAGSADRSTRGASGSTDDASGPAVDRIRRAASAREEIEERIEALCLERFHEERFAAVALAGRVPVKVDASYGAIEPGDALVPSPVPGVAMKAAGPGLAVGLALEGLSEGRGRVLAFVRSGSSSGPVLDAVVAEATASVGPEKQRTDPAGQITLLASAAETNASATPAQARSRFDDTAPFSIHRRSQTEGVAAVGADEPAGGAPAGGIGPEGVTEDGAATTARPRGADSTELFRVDARGNVYARGAFHPASMDLAEYFPLSEPAAAGDVVVVDAEAPGRYALARRAGDPAVVGIVSGEPGVLLGSGIERISKADAGLASELEEARLLEDGEREEEVWAALHERFREAHAPVALSGTVLCKVDAGYGAILPGDLLTSSPTPGHAMRADSPAPGTILGKALEPLGDGMGAIRVLVMMR